MGTGYRSVPDAAAAGSDQMDFNKISKVTPGMTMAEVIVLEGPPSDMKNNTYYYKGRGRIVFDGSASPSDSTKVLRVEEDLLEDGVPP